MWKGINPMVGFAEAMSFVERARAPVHATLKWASWSTWRRTVVQLVIAALLVGSYIATLNYLLYSANEERESRMSTYLAGLEKNGYLDAIDAINLCIDALKDKDANVALFCEVAELRYDINKRGLLPEHVERTTTAKAYPMMRNDMASLLRQVDMRILRDQPYGGEHQLLAVLAGPVGVVVLVTIQVLATGMVLGYAWMVGRRRRVVRKVRERDVVHGDMPNLPHDRPDPADCR